MLKAITIPMLIALAALSQLVHAEVVDESWRQVYDFQSKMAAQGSSKAQFTLGEMYENGRGVAKNYDTAIDWYNKAKSTGHADAEQRITMLNRAIEQQANDNEKAVAKRKADKEKAVAKRKADKEKAVAKRKAEKERAQQKAIEQKRAAEVKRKEQASEKKSVAKAKKAAKQKKSAQAKLSPEERAKKIKAAQERAKKIAQENEKKQQQEADAALEKYRSSMSAKASTDKDEPKAKIPEKYIDPFE